MTSLPKRGRAGSSNAGPLEIDVFAGQSGEYIVTEPTATVTAFPLDWKTRRSLAAKRRAELIRLALGRREHRICVNASQFVWMLAVTLGSAEAGPYSIGKRHVSLRWYGLTLESLRISIKQAELGEIPDDELSRVIQGVEIATAAHGPKTMRAEKVGEHLQVTAAEREMFELRTIEACDETREDRKARQAEARRQLNRERMRVQRGAVPRTVYEAQSLSATKPWVEENISRRTWERRRKADASPCTHVLSLNLRAQTCDTVFEEAVDEGGADASGTFLKNKKILMQIMCPEESRPVIDYVSEKGDVADLITRATKILKAQRPKGQRFYNDPLEETLTLLKGLSMIARHERQSSSENSRFNLRIAAEEGAKLIRSQAANDNRLTEIARHLAA